MAINVSPGVFTKIIDLSEYVRQVPSTIGFIPIICEKGPDNELIFTNSVDFYTDFGEPNINWAGSAYGQGPYVCDSFLRESDALYVIRCMPTDAAFANVTLIAEATSYGTDGTSNVTVGSEAGMNNFTEINTLLIDDMTDANNDGTDVAVMFYGAGRGEWYENFKVRIAAHSNPSVAENGIYLLDIYKRQEDDDPETGLADWGIILTLEVSFDPNSLDSAGDSLWIEDVVNTYSKDIKCKASATLCTYLVTNGNCDWSEPFTITDSTDTGSGSYQFDNGSDGTLFDTNTGRITTSVGDSLLTLAYTGLLPKISKTEISDYLTVDEVLDTDDHYFTIVLDGGYSTNIKQGGIYVLVTTRKDCVALIDNGDNISPNAAVTARDATPFNTKYMARYEPYSKVFDKFTGRDIWVTPVYHMANIVPYTDNVAELWFAAAGFNRATIGIIKDMRFSPRLADRDRFYLKQINPIVKFNVGYTMWGQLTTQSRPSALQDLNIIRLVLYIKRALEQFCKFFVFEQNDAITWEQIGKNIRSFLTQIQNKRGLYSYSVEVGSTEYEIKQKKVHVNVILNPVRVIEQIHINLFIV